MTGILIMPLTISISHFQMDAVDLLYEAARRNEFPSDDNCLRTFLFDRTTDWSYLLGLYIGANYL